MHFQLLLSSLSLASAAVMASDPTLQRPTVNDSIQPNAYQIPFPQSNLTPDVGIRTFSRIPSANEITTSPDSTTSLSKRTIYGPICSGGHTAPSREDCVRVINAWAAANQQRSLAANQCTEVIYGSCLGYICATRCNSIMYGTSYVANQLQGINQACVVRHGEAGYIHSTGGNGVAKFEIGLERYAEELPPYEPCA